MKRERTSYAFLMEMIWVCAFFLICACIFVMAFAKAEQMSRRADILNQAVQAASNAMEETFALGEAANEADFSTADFAVNIETSLDDGLILVTVQIMDTGDGSVIYTLTGAHTVLEGGAV